MERGYDSTLRRSAPTTRGHVELTSGSQAAEYVSFGLPVMSARTYPVGGRTADADSGSSPATPVDDPIDDWAQVVDLRYGAASTVVSPGPGWYPYPDDATPVRWWSGSEWGGNGAGSTEDHAAAVAVGGLALATAASVSRYERLESSTIDAGWYVDPSDQDRHRWWDGQQWTDQVHADAATISAPVVEDVAQASAPTTAPALETGWYSDPLDASGLRWWDGRWTEETVAPAGAAEAVPESLPPGWFVDPRDESGLRWWDGSAWTEQTHPPAGSTTPEPEVQPTALVPPIAAAAAASAWYADPSDPETLRWWDGTAWTDHTTPAARADLASETGAGALEADPAPGADGMPVAAAAAAAAVVGSEAGWYADPLAAALRWWDGTGWTNDTHLVTSTVPLGFAPLALAGGAALGMAGVGLLSASTIPGEIVESAPAAPVQPKIARRPVYRRWWFWLLVLGSAALWFLAWQDSQSADVPSVPGITVVPAPSPTSVPPGPSPGEGFLPSLRPEPLGG